jgi:hypothetical protein
VSRRAVVLLFCCALLACREDAPPPAPTATNAPEEQSSIPATPDNDADNSLNLMYGATVVSRDGELHLETSAIHTIDGFDETTWTSAPGVPEETLVYSMLAPTRLLRVGVSTTKGDDAIESVVFDASMDGKKWTELGTLKTARIEQRQPRRQTGRRALPPRAHDRSAEALLRPPARRTRDRRRSRAAGHALVHRLLEDQRRARVPHAERRPHQRKGSRAIRRRTSKAAPTTAWA